MQYNKILTNKQILRKKMTLDNSLVTTNGAPVYSSVPLQDNVGDSHSTAADNPTAAKANQVGVTTIKAWAPTLTRVAFWTAVTVAVCLTIGFLVSNPAGWVTAGVIGTAIGLSALGILPPFSILITTAFLSVIGAATIGSLFAAQKRIDKNLELHEKKIHKNILQPLVRSTPQSGHKLWLSLSPQNFWNRLEDVASGKLGKNGGNHSGMISRGLGRWTPFRWLKSASEGVAFEFIGAGKTVLADLFWAVGYSKKAKSLRGGALSDFKLASLLSGHSFGKFHFSPVYITTGGNSSSNLPNKNTKIPSPHLCLPKTEFLQALWASLTNRQTAKKVHPASASSNLRPSESARSRISESSRSCSYYTRNSDIDPEDIRRSYEKSLSLGGILDQDSSNNDSYQSDLLAAAYSDPKEFKQQVAAQGKPHFLQSQEEDDHSPGNSSLMVECHIEEDDDD